VASVQVGQGVGDGGGWQLLQDGAIPPVTLAHAGNENTIKVIIAAKNTIFFIVVPFESFLRAG
jgi:hypothetical protein